MDDLIRRNEAVNCLCNGKCNVEGRWCDDGDCLPVRRLKKLPAVPPVSYGDPKCPYCHTDCDDDIKPLERNCHAFIEYGLYGGRMVLRANGWHVEVKINFCPMCGREFERG